MPPITEKNLPTSGAIEAYFSAKAMHGKPPRISQGSDCCAIQGPLIDAMNGISTTVQKGKKKKKKKKGENGVGVSQTIKPLESKT